MKTNPLTAIDFYKADHRSQYPKGTTEVYSNFTPRSAKHAKVSKYFDNKVVFFGLQYFIKEFLQDTWNEGFFNQPIEVVLEAYKKRIETSLGPGAITFEHIEALHNLGYLPLKIKALEEGTLVPIGVPCLTIVNTEPEFFWITNYLESVMSAYLWKPMTSATTALEYKKILTKYAKQTGVPLEFTDFQGHDFSFRGMSGLQDAAMSGAGHLLSFVGTDTVPAIDLLENYYHADSSKELVGCSVPATEHSVMCLNTKDTEVETFKRLITETYPAGIVSIVSDTWDFWKVLTEYTVELKDEILSREGKTVFRPDSGDPVDIICGSLKEVPQFNSLEEAIYTLDDEIKDEMNERCGQGSWGDSTVETIVSIENTLKKLYFSIEYGQLWVERGENLFYVDSVTCTGSEPAILSPQQKGSVEVLWDIFGGTINEEGYKVLNEKVGLIYGDSITLERAEEILKRLEAKGFASSNIVFGIGSYTYQMQTRDSFGFAMKATSGVVNGERLAIFKDPKTDSGTKKSAKGLLKVYEDNGTLKLKDQCTEEEEQEGLLKVVYHNGQIIRQTTLQMVRDRVLSTI